MQIQYNHIPSTTLTHVHQTVRFRRIGNLDDKTIYVIWVVIRFYASWCFAWLLENQLTSNVFK